MTRAIIAYGANLGDRTVIIRSALAALAAHPEVILEAESPRYETPALTATGVDAAAPRYHNGVVRVATTLGAPELLALLHAIEERHGRVRAERWGSRTLDLDLIDYGGRIMHTPTLTVPHPRAHERAFVLQPWLDLVPDAVLPGRGSVAALRAEARDEVVRIADGAGAADGAASADHSPMPGAEPDPRSGVPEAEQ